MANFGTFWAGRPLSKIEELSLSSFLYHGHTIKIFLYDMNIDVPDGVIKADANEILPESFLFKSGSSYAPFSDIFRYNMIEKTNLVWTDTDNVCMSKEWFNDEYIYGSQRSPASYEKFCNSILYFTPGSELSKKLISESMTFNRNYITWSEVGPILTTKLVEELDLEKFAKPSNVFYPIPFFEWRLLWDKGSSGKVMSRVMDSHVVSIWHSMAASNGMNLDYFPDGSFLDILYKKIVLNKSN